MKTRRSFVTTGSTALAGAALVPGLLSANARAESVTNRKIVLASHPRGKPTAADFRLEQDAVPALKSGEILLHTRYLSLDPYMRGRMSAAKSYADPVAIGEVMTAETAGVVVESKSALYAVGDHVCSRSGWQEYFVSDDTDVMTYKVDASKVPLSDRDTSSSLTDRPSSCSSPLSSSNDFRLFLSSSTDWLNSAA